MHWACTLISGSSGTIGQIESIEYNAGNVCFGECCCFRIVSAACCGERARAGLLLKNAAMKKMTPLRQAAGRGEQGGNAVFDVIRPGWDVEGEMNVEAVAATGSRIFYIYVFSTIYEYCICHEI